MRWAVGRYTPFGQPDSSFGSDGFVLLGAEGLNSEAFDIMVEQTGSVLVGGYAGAAAVLTRLTGDPTFCAYTSCSCDENTCVIIGDVTLPASTNVTIGGKVIMVEGNVILGNGLLITVGGFLSVDGTISLNGTIYLSTFASGRVPIANASLGFSGTLSSVVINDGRSCGFTETAGETLSIIVDNGCSGLTVAVKIGIGVGIVAAATAAMFMIAFCTKRRNQKRTLKLRKEIKDQELRTLHSRLEAVNSPTI